MIHGQLHLLIDKEYVIYWSFCIYWPNVAHLKRMFLHLATTIIPSLDTFFDQSSFHFLNSFIGSGERYSIYLPKTQALLLNKLFLLCRTCSYHIKHKYLLIAYDGLAAMSCKSNLT